MHNFDWTCRWSRVLFQWATWLRRADCFTSDLRRADEQLEVSAIDIFVTFSTDWVFWGISFLDRKSGSDSRDRHSWFCLSLDSSCYDRSYTAGIPLLAHGLTVKLSPCPCSHSSLTGRIAAWVCVSIPNAICYSLRLARPHDDSASGVSLSEPAG